jgi:hypothetical protein
VPQALETVVSGRISSTQQRRSLHRASQQDLLCALLINMGIAVATAIIAVLGTLLGSATTYVFQQKSSERAEKFSLQQQLRAERMAVYSDFGGAIAEARRGQYDWWNRRNEAPDSPACLDARVEAYRLRGLAAHALFRVQLVASSQTMVDVAQRAYDLTASIHHAATETELKSLGKQASEALDQFIAIASHDVKGSNTDRSSAEIDNEPVGQTFNRRAPSG